MLRLVMPQTVTIVVDVLAWGVFHAATGYAAHRLGADRLARDGWGLRERRFEAGGHWYRRRLRIHRWKDRVPEAGALFDGGISKRALPALDAEGLQVFVRETRRAELAHWWALWCSPLFLLWNPPLAAALLVSYGVLVNLPFIAIQRHNRFRSQALLERLSRRRSNA
jgi:glycosyl-4,4'-diaponeurosporenoate acyltransferase